MKLCWPRRRGLGLFSLHTTLSHNFTGCETCTVHMTIFKDLPAISRLSSFGGLQCIIWSTVQCFVLSHRGTVGGVGTSVCDCFRFSSAQAYWVRFGSEDQPISIHPQHSSCSAFSCSCMRYTQQCQDVGSNNCCRRSDFRLVCNNCGAWTCQAHSRESQVRGQEARFTIGCWWRRSFHIIPFVWSLPVEMFTSYQSHQACMILVEIWNRSPRC